MDYYGYRAILDSANSPAHSIAEAIQHGLSATSGTVVTGDGLGWELSQRSLHKMVSATNSNGKKAHQKERITAIQHIKEIPTWLNSQRFGPTMAVTRLLMQSTSTECRSLLAALNFASPCYANTSKIRAKKLKHKMHSMSLDGVPATRPADGELSGLAIALLDAKVRAVSSRWPSPSAGSDFNIAHGG